MVSNGCKQDGSKWACQSCLKGHRVSGCTHTGMLRRVSASLLSTNSLTDRELTLVPKKGRPVTQCQHCRLERKKRSAHVSCDCGQAEKPHHSKEKCIHLRDAEERAKAGYYDDCFTEKDAAHLAAVAEEQGCCCHHGGKCTCAILKRETGDIDMAPHGPAVKPRLEKMSSESAITVFTKGHHKPVHRKNHLAHEAGMPYKIPMPRSQTEHDVSAAARRSVDSLALDNNMPFQPSGFTPQTSAPFNTGRRKSKSEQPSPKIVPVGRCDGGLGDAKLHSIDFSTLSQTPTNQSIASNASDSYGFPAFDPMSGVTDASYDSWSALPSADSSIMPNNNPFGVWPTHNESTNLAQPALTAASSGTTSESDEMPQVDDSYDFAMPNIQEDARGFNSVSLPSGNSPQFNRRSLPPNFFGNVDFNMPDFYPEWQLPVNNFNATDSSKTQMEQDTPSASYDDSWLMPTIRPITSVPQRALGGLPSASRLQSRSVGSTSAPSDDIIRQLFPEIDINGSMFGATSSPQSNMTFDKTTNWQPSTSATSAPMDYGPMDTNVSFTSQPWSDGSLSVPNDTFTTSYDLDQDFSNPDFSANWSQ